MPGNDETVLGLDVGQARIGLAITNTIAKLPSPLTTIKNTPSVINQIADIVKAQNVVKIVVGLPIGLSGQDTEQTAYSREFAQKVEKLLGLPVYLMDETLTSVEAEKELRSRGKNYDKGEVDALAATLILEDYMRGLSGGN